MVTVGLVSHVSVKESMPMETDGLDEDIIFLCRETRPSDNVVASLTTVSGVLCFMCSF